MLRRMRGRARRGGALASLTVENSLKAMDLIASRRPPGARWRPAIRCSLAQTLRMPRDEVPDEAEYLEHAVSDALIDRIGAYLDYPTAGPYGDPIPRAGGSLPERPGLPTAQLGRGRRFRPARVVGQDPAFLRYLTECGLDLDTAGELVENRPEAWALVLRVGGRTVALGLDAAEKVLVGPRRRAKLGLWAFPSGKTSPAVG